MKGSGKYGAIAETAMKETAAAGVVLIVFGGNKGEGFEVQMRQPFDVKSHRTALAIILRDIATQLEASS